MALPYNQDFYNVDVQSEGDVCSLDEAIKRTQDFLLSQQYPEGYWWGELEGNVTIASHTIILYKILGIEKNYPLHKFERYLRRMQCSHGGWEFFYGDGGYLSGAIEAYMALRLLGVPQSDPALQKALKVILDGGGVTKARIFTKICLALLGCFDWRGLPSLPAWVSLCPAWFLSSMYETACWARGCVVPLLVIFDKKPVFKVSPEVSFDELYAEGRAHARKTIPFSGDWTSKFFIAVDRIFKMMERFGVVPFRQWGLREAEKWMLQRQEASGDFIGQYPPMFYSLVCMKTLGYETTEPVVQRALLSLKRFTIETEKECWVQASISPVWDTALIVRALAESGIPPDHPALQKAGQWLLQKQILKPGDWAFKTGTGHLAGGWAFQFYNRWYPDLDDSAVVVMALDSIKLPDEDVKNGAIARCLKWISTMQSRNGGWAAYDKNSDQHWIDSTPFSDLKAMLDSSTSDVSARVLEMVGRLKHLREPRQQRCALSESLSHLQEAIVHGLAYLRKDQEGEGCWWGRWGVNYIYGTCGALVALSLVAPTTHEEEIARGAKWLVQVQNRVGKRKAGHAPEDGGWGETCFTYNDPALKGESDGSTASQTAWALQGLLAAGDALGKYEVEAIEQGVQYLLVTQRKDGSWHEAHFTGCGFPIHFYLKYHYYAQHFPLSALARYRTRLLQASLNHNQQKY
uniref:Terpene cyclase/mutase family member n=1 Tax=Leptochilus pothifolius TaxID=493398 RepID=A0A0T7AQB2_9MONI|nr:hop-17(21)-ene synthase [Leptochilus pothifolius]